MKEMHHIQTSDVGLHGDDELDTSGEQDGSNFVEEYEEGDDCYGMDIDLGDEYVIEVNYDGSRERLSKPRRRRNMSGEERRKRRRKCGQCGPCQVKVDCGHCKYCERKDILKQACIYKKCVYLRKGENCLSSPKRRASIRDKSSPGQKEFVPMVNRSVHYTDMFLAEEENDHHDELEPGEIVSLVADVSDDNESFSEQLPEVGAAPVDQNEVMQEGVAMSPSPTEAEGHSQEGPQGDDQAMETPAPRPDLAAQISKDLKECAKKSLSDTSPDAIARRRMMLERALNVPQVAESSLGYSVFNISSKRNRVVQVTPNLELSSSNCPNVQSSSVHQTSAIQSGPGYAISHPISNPASLTPSDPIVPPACPPIKSLSPIGDGQTPISPFNDAANIVYIKQEPTFIVDSTESFTSSATEMMREGRDQSHVNGAEKENGLDSGIQISSAFSLQETPLPALHADQYPMFVKTRPPSASCQNPTGPTVHHTSNVPHKSLHAMEHFPKDMNSQEITRYYPKHMLRDPNHNLFNPHELDSAMPKNIFKDPFENGVNAYGNAQGTNVQDNRTEFDIQKSIGKERRSSREGEIIGLTSAQNKLNRNLHNMKETSVHVCNPFQEGYLQGTMKNHQSPADFYSRSRLFHQDDFVQKRNLKRPNTDTPRRKYKKRVCKNKQPNDMLHAPSEKELLKSHQRRLSNNTEADNLLHNDFRAPYSMMNRPMYPPSLAGPVNNLPYDPLWNPAMRPPFPGPDFFNRLPSHPGLLPPHMTSAPPHMTPAPHGHASAQSMLPPLIPPSSLSMITPSQIPMSSSQRIVSPTCHRPPSPRMMPPHPFMQASPSMAPPAHMAFNRPPAPYLPMGYSYPPRHFPPGLAALGPPNANHIPPAHVNGCYPLSYHEPPFVHDPIKEVPYPEIKKQLNDRDAMRENYVKEASDLLPDANKAGMIQGAMNAKGLPDRPSHRHIMSPERFMNSPEMACDVITIDDFMVNAYIRGDGANSIEIQMDSVSLLDESLNVKSKKSEAPLPTVTEKVQLNGTLMLKQDLGEEGVIQMEIPGHAVTVELSTLDYKLTELSSNRTELLEFIEKGVQAKV